MADAERLATLEIEAEVRRLAARYMALCDEPPTAAPGPDFEQLFTSDLVWEGVGGKAASEFSRVEGRDKLLAWFAALRDPPKYAFNIHLLTSEAIVARDGTARGTWVMLQAAARQSGEAELRVARVTIDFREEEGGWRIAHFRTESLLRFDAGAAAVAALIEGLKA
ncbi:nuclear transport factor 2 family protein [Sphingopyxis sp. MSC1_008]|jgi:hypothetical protein|uniref:nuclear transport factor 2 family protein n=1 Tax=Sphingopyxis sp. MSC1_008 TaxID=2909265 RepID=UPI0020BFFC50|nr:nuclear transport factor 2 family protein [Sphingopyxis sp. MSC1_008]